MLKKIAGTILTRLLAAVISFIVLVITSRVLGAEVRGIISMIVVGITVLVLVNEVFGGPALVYFIPRNKLKRLLLPAYAWAVTTCALLSFVLGLTHVIPQGYALHTFFLSLLQCIGSIHLIILLGREKIKYYNYINLAQVIVLVISLTLFVFILNNRTVDAWVWSMYCSYGVMFVMSIFALIPELKTGPEGEQSSYAHIVRNGFYTQVASLSHLLTNRISYYFLNSAWGLAAVGIYSTGTAVAEALLMLSGSVATVIYTRIANTTDKDYSRKITLRLAKLCLLLTLPGIIILALLPQEFYTALFGWKFSSIGRIVLLLGPGILALSFSSIITHYFSGTGKNHINTISAVISLAVTTALAFGLVPQHKMAGAAFATSAAHCVSAAYLSLMFLYESKYSIAKLLPGIDDYREIKRDIRNLIQLKK